MKSKIHTHSWADSTNESCSFCGKDMKYCTSPNCYLYMCKNKGGKKPLDKKIIV